ncbi:MAG TPA: hypothetical protein VL426_02965 [Candidatus Binatia bacterium]|nr:hypothetical protein [Candidatus Binatia bacterium]
MKIRPAFIVLLALPLIGAGCFAAPKPPVAANKNAPGGVACTMEAKQCPDGSSVGRVPPNCEFAPCPEAKVVCPQDLKTCPGGSVVGRYPPDCKFADCPPEHWP